MNINAVAAVGFEKLVFGNQGAAPNAVPKVKRNSLFSAPGY
jgi:hypothetical protein